jgi:hypothetical protein
VGGADKRESDEGADTLVVVAKEDMDQSVPGRSVERVEFVIDGGDEGFLMHGAPGTRDVTKYWSIAVDFFHLPQSHVDV